MKKLSVLIAVLMVITGALVFAGGQQEAETKKVTVAIADDWQGTDHFQADQINQFQKLIGDSLIVLDSDKNMVANVASSVEIDPDGAYVRLTLDEAMTFGDGTPVTPEDVKASILYGLENSPYKWDYMNIVDFKIDGNTIDLITDSYSSTMLYNLCSTYIPIAQKKQIEALSVEEMLTQSDQYGLFYVDEFVSGSHYTLLRNDGYVTHNKEIENKGSSHIEEVTIKIMPDEFSRVNALLSGEIDIAAHVPAENVPQLREDPNIEVIEYVPAGMRWLALNASHPFFQDIKVREAIALAINREEIADANAGLLKTAYSFIVPEMLDYDQRLYDYYKNTYCNDVEKAKRLLDEAGWKDSDGDGVLDKDGQAFEVSVLGPASQPDIKTTTLVFQNQMKKLGIKVDINILEYGYLREKAGNQDYDMAFVGMVWIDPPSILPYMIQDEASVIDQSYFDIAANAAFAESKEARLEQLGQAQRILMDELYKIPVCQSIDFLAYNKRITGLKILPDTDILFNDVDIIE